MDWVRQECAILGIWYWAWKITQLMTQQGQNGPHTKSINQYGVVIWYQMPKSLSKSILKAPWLLSQNLIVIIIIIIIILQLQSRQLQDFTIHFDLCYLICLHRLNKMTRSPVDRWWDIEFYFGETDDVPKEPQLVILYVISKAILWEANWPTCGHKISWYDP